MRLGREGEEKRRKMKGEIRIRDEGKGAKEDLGEEGKLVFFYFVCMSDDLGCRPV
jgi:hypothetical protein